MTVLPQLKQGESAPTTNISKDKESNVDAILTDIRFFVEFAFDRTHTFRNCGTALLFQRGIHRYYYSSTYNISSFRAVIETDMAYYEKWLIPLLGNGSIEFFSSNQEWTRMEKVERISTMECCFDYLQVCLVKSGNCGRCIKCQRTLIELDALGDEVLERFGRSFDLETYKRENRKQWFSNLIIDKEASGGEAHYYDEAFIVAAQNHRESANSGLPAFVD